MPRSSLADIRALPDPLLSYNWDLFIPNVPTGDFRSPTIKCQNVNIPVVQTDDVPVTLHGVTVKYAGREMYTNQFTATFLETRDMTTRDVIRGWIEYCRNSAANTGTYKAQYATTALLALYDDAGNTVRTVNIYGCFPQSLDEPSLDGSGSQPVLYSVVFNFDFTSEQS